MYDIEFQNCTDKMIDSRVILDELIWFDKDLMVLLSDFNTGGAHQKETLYMLPASRMVLHIVQNAKQIIFSSCRVWCFRRKVLETNLNALHVVARSYNWQLT